MKRSLEPAHGTVALKQGKQTSGDDDDDDEDEDYDPTKDKEEQAELLADAVEETWSKKEAGADGSSYLYTEIQGVARKRRVDELWESMKSEEATEPVKVSATATGRKKRRKDTRKVKKILAGIFGSSSVAGNIVAKAKESSQVERSPKKLSKKAGIKTKASVAGLQIARMKTVTETAKFAGQTIEVKRQVLSAASSSSGRASDTATKVAESSLDAALSAITGSTKINTVTKSSADWENFKEETGAAGELEQAAKDGFLAKKEFLDRCDVRAFEKERDTRLAKSK